MDHNSSSKHFVNKLNIFNVSTGKQGIICERQVVFIQIIGSVSEQACGLGNLKINFPKSISCHVECVSIKKKEIF